MATNKSDVRRVFEEWTTPNGKCPARKEWNQALPAEQYKWHPYHREVIDMKMPTFSLSGAFRVHTLIDGFQTIQHLHDGSKSPSGSIAWGTARKRYVQSMLKWLMEDIDLNATQTVVLAFDNGKKCSPAKRATQVKRRAGVFKSAMRNGHRVELERAPNEIESVQIDARERIPPDWRTRSIWPKYRSAVNRFLVDPLLRPTVSSSSSSIDHEAYDDDDEMCDVHVWLDGHMYTRDRSTSESDERWTTCDKLTSAHKNMGEFDFFALRYAMNEVIDVIEQRRREANMNADDAIVTTDLHSSVYNLANIVVRVVSNDTDLLVYFLWFLEHVHHKYDLRSDDLPAIFCISPWAPNKVKSYVISVTRMYLALCRRTSSFYKQPGYAVRNICVCAFFWGGDLMPSPHGVTARTALDVYRRLNPFLRTGLCRSSSSSGTCKEGGTLLNGAALRVLFALWYAVKCVWKRKVTGASANADTADEVLDELEERFSATKIREFERWIEAECNGSKAARDNGDGDTRRPRRKKPLSAAQTMPPLESRVLHNRIGLTYFTMYCVEHALMEVPGHTVSLHDIGLMGPVSGRDGAYYVDMFDTMKEVLTEKQQARLRALGLFGEGRYFRWCDAIMQKGAETYEYNTQEIKTLGECAEVVFTWPE